MIEKKKKVMLWILESQYETVVAFLDVCTGFEFEPMDECTQSEQQLAAEEAVNLFTPMKRLQDLLSEHWFEHFSACKKTYTVEWREELISDLMSSEHGKVIAAEWTDRKKRKLVRYKLVGALISADVLRTNFNALAPMLCKKGDKPTTLAKYMGYGKKQPYYLWLKEWIRQKASAK